MPRLYTWCVDTEVSQRGLVVYQLYLKHSWIARPRMERGSTVRGGELGTFAREENYEGKSDKEEQNSRKQTVIPLDLRFLPSVHVKPPSSSEDHATGTSLRAPPKVQNTTAFLDKEEQSPRKQTVILPGTQFLPTVHVKPPSNSEDHATGTGLRAAPKVQTTTAFLDKEEQRTRKQTVILPGKPFLSTVQVKPPSDPDHHTTKAALRKVPKTQETTVFLDKKEQNKRKKYNSRFLPTVHIKPPPDPNSPGENGTAVRLTNLTDAEESLRKELLEKYGLDEFVSRQISLHRTLPYSRPESCRRQTFLSNLPTVSIIVVFHNEADSVLKRTLHSILDNTPSALLQEVLLVDDFSNNDDLKQDLEDYVSRLPRIRLVRNRRREGLTRARIRAANLASGDVLVFLDSHVECNTGWLEPLIDRIARDRKTGQCW
ncbi:Polypeptide N-acetylgalactosaminyltransferase 12 [Branchiostoma belcheri]|nr:Polypeptide N-acetylgalactosaminyltransferase 12 [Branchiostoma belcheri]